MQLNKNQETETNLRDLFFFVLYHWRSMLAAILAGALLFGGYAYLSNRKKPSKASGSAVQSESVDFQGNYAMSNQIYEGLLEQSKDYYNHSLIMKLDPYHVWTATAIYTVVMTNPETGEIVASSHEPPAFIARAYTAVVGDAVNLDELQTLFGTDNTEYIHEMISANLYSAGDLGGISFCIQVIGPDEETVNSALDLTENYLLNYSKGQIQQLGSHRLVRMQHFARQTVSTSLADKQVAVAKNISTWQKGITDNKTAADKLSSSADASEPKSAKKSIKKYLALGALAGLVAWAGFQIASYMTSRKLRDTNLLKGRLNIPVLGELTHSRARHPGKGIDRIIEKWEHGKNPQTNDSILDNACALIRERCGDGRLLLTGTISGSGLKELCETLSAKLGEAYAVSSEGDYLVNSRAVTEAASAGSVILVEEKDVSKIEQIDSMAEKLMISKANVVGAILI